MNLKFQIRISGASTRLLADSMFSQYEFIDPCGFTLVEVIDDTTLVEKLFRYRAGYYSLNVFVDYQFSDDEAESICHFEIRPAEFLNLSQEQDNAASIEILDNSETVISGKYGDVRVLKSLDLGQVKSEIGTEIFGIIAESGETVVGQEIFDSFFQETCSGIPIGTDSSGNSIILLSPHKQMPFATDDGSIYFHKNEIIQCGLLSYSAEIETIEVARISDPVPFLSGGNPYNVVSRRLKNELQSKGVSASFVPVLRTGSNLYGEYLDKLQKLLKMWENSGRMGRIRLFEGTYNRRGRS